MARRYGHSSNMDKPDSLTAEPVDLKHVQHLFGCLTGPLFTSDQKTTTDKSTELEHVVAAVAELDFDLHGYAILN